MKRGLLPHATPLNGSQGCAHRVCTHASNGSGPYPKVHKKKAQPACARGACLDCPWTSESRSLQPPHSDGKSHQQISERLWCGLRHANTCPAQNCRDPSSADPAHQGRRQHTSKTYGTNIEVLHKTQSPNMIYTQQESLAADTTH